MCLLKSLLPSNLNSPGVSRDQRKKPVLPSPSRKILQFKQLKPRNILTEECYLDIKNHHERGSRRIPNCRSYITENQKMNYKWSGKKCPWPIWRFCPSVFRRRPPGSESKPGPPEVLITQSLHLVQIFPSWSNHPISLSQFSFQSLKNNDAMGHI
jgi:hypothetical protein